MALFWGYGSNHYPRFRLFSGIVGRCKHKLSDILVITLATYLCGGGDFIPMYELRQERDSELYPLEELPNVYQCRHVRTSPLAHRASFLVSLPTSVWTRFCEVLGR